ncbi:hypothetical protein D3C81_1674900 [compost metagenome]
MIDIFGVGYLGPGRQLDSLLRCVGAAILMADIQRHTNPLFSEVQTDYAGFALDCLVLPFGVTGLPYTVEAYSKALVLAEAPTDVHGAANLVG